MMLLRPLLPFLLSCLAFAQDAAVDDRPAANPIGPDAAQRIVAEGIGKSQAMRILRDLTGKIGHRLTGSDNFTKACEWARAEFSAMGLSNVHLEKWGEWKLVWNRGQWIGRVTEPEPFEMYVATEAWTAGTGGPKKGAVVLAPASSQIEDPASFAGKWVIGKRRPGASVRKAVQAAGALGIVYRASDPNAEFPTRVRVFGNHQTAMKPLAEVPTMPEIAVRADDFDKLLGLVQSGQATTCEFDIQNEFRDGPIELHNVIAEIPGTEWPDEVVIVSAHLDSWHQAQGCTDNGTGTATTIEAARILSAAGAKPKRTIRFCLWGGEEQGLLGSRAYVQKHRTAMQKVSAVFNHDTGTNWAQSLAVTAAMRDQLAPVFANVTDLLQAPDADWTGPVFELRTVQRVAGGGGSDHASFLAAGVPGLDWGLKGRSNYFQHTWHTQWDTIDVAIEEYQRHTSTVIALAALGTANLDAPLDRQNVGGGGGGGQAIAIAAGWFEAEFDGLTFKSVIEGGRAAKMGVQKGDVLKKVDGQEVEQHRQIFQFAREAEGDTVTFTFQRGEKAFEATMTKDDLPARRERRPAGEAAPPGTPSSSDSGTPPNTRPPQRQQ
jgi:hypothetical protein